MLCTFPFPSLHRRSVHSDYPAADVATLAKQVKALDSTGANERLTKMEQSTQRKFEDMEADSEAMTMQIAAMQQDNEDREDEKKAAFKNEKALIKRIAEMEAALKTYEQSMGLLDKRISEAQLDQIKAQLETVTERLAREGPQMKDLAKNVNAFGVGIAHLQEEIEKMRPELEALATKQAAAVAAVEPEDDATAGASTEIAPPKKKAKKSHKWGGSGADREVVSMGAEAFNLPVKDPTAQDDEGGENDIENEIIVSKPPTLKPKGKKPKPIPPHLRKVDPSAPKKKSHKWSGGGADAAVIHSGILPADEVAATPATTAASHNEKIVRSNRFWVEYASSPVDEDERTG